MQIFRYMSFIWEDYEREMEKKDELSVVMMLDKLRDATEFARLGTGMEAGYLGEVLSGSPEYLLGIIAQMAEVLLSRLNVPSEEAAAFTNQIKEKHMGELFSNFKGYDVQATRRQAYQEGERKGEIKKLIGQIRKKAAKNQTAEETAEMLEEDLGFVRRIYDLIAIHSEWDDENIWEEVKKIRESTGS